MIRYLINFALRNRILVLSVAVVLFIWGIVSFHNLPVEAYPDVADTYAQIITQWPGHAAEEIEQQITIPLEVTLNGVNHMTHLRSVSLAGLSVITIIYDDEITTFTARTEVIDRLQQVTLPTGVSPNLGPDYSPTGQIMFYTLQSTNPKYDVMELKTLQDWFVLNQLKSVPNIVDVNIFGGPTREYQVQIDPGKLVSYGLSLNQVEQALPDGPKLVKGQEPETLDRPTAVSKPMPLFSESEMGDFRSQWSKVQTGFVDEPRRTVEEADKLVAAVMQRLAEGFANERSGLEKQWDSGDNVSTEDLRIALQRYRSFFDRLLNL